MASPEATKPEQDNIQDPTPGMEAYIEAKTGGTGGLNEELQEFC